MAHSGREGWPEHITPAVALPRIPGAAIVGMSGWDDSTLAKQSDLKVSVWRGAEAGRYQQFVVPQRDNQTVLDVVTYVQRHLDSTLCYRFACRVGVCGSCAMTVNGRPRWTCRTHVSKVVVNGALEVAPLANLPVIKDLATDMSGFFEKWRDARGAFVPSRTRRDEIEAIRPESAGRRAASAAIECINCGVCYAACDTVRWNADYLGPAALNRVWTLVNDVRDAGNAERLAVAAASGGCHACHSHQSCQEHCPQALNPTASIAGLKRRAALAYLRGEIKPANRAASRGGASQ
jgi:fumarate reductase iron-sulfur subunit